VWLREPNIILHAPKMPPKGSRKSAIAAPSKTLVLDNGAYTIKAGVVPGASTEPSYDDCKVIPNCIARSTRDKCTYVASELDACKDFGELAFRRPVEKGFIVNWEAEKAIWEHEFMGAVGAQGDGSMLNDADMTTVRPEGDESTLD